jgi:regulation of enolase protein 1 (concanavalin A-like superfamily)
LLGFGLTFYGFISARTGRVGPEGEKRLWGRMSRDKADGNKKEINKGAAQSSNNAYLPFEPDAVVGQAACTPATRTLLCKNLHDNELWSKQNHRK